MQVEIYADIVFLINFIMDLMIFLIVSMLVHKKVKFLRLIIGSALASFLYCVLIFTPILRNYYNFFSSLVVLMLGIITVFGIKDVKYFVQLIFLSHISAFAVGGLSIALFYYTNITDLIGNMLGFTIEYFSFKLLIITACLMYIIIKLSLGWLNSSIIKKQCFYNISIFSGNKEVSLKALVDTGNSLCDPITKSPVIIAEYKSIKHFLPENLQELFNENRENDLNALISLVSQSEAQNKFRLIPFKSLGMENGMLIGFKPDKVHLYKEDETYITVNEIVVGIYNLTLSAKGEYQGLLNPEILIEK